MSDFDYRQEIWTSIVTAIIAFVAVNIDEFIVLVVFFARVDHTDFKNIHVVTGQLVAFTIIFIISAFGMVFGMFLDMQYVALIGLLPLFIGIYELYKVITLN